MLKIAIIIGSTRPGRKGEAVARWVEGIARQRQDAAFSLVDIQSYELPLLDEPVPASQGKYSKPHTQAWAAAIAGFDAFVFVTPEYNFGPSAALKNALDFLYAEWGNKAAGFVSYGGSGGVRAVDHLRQVVGALQIADVRPQVTLNLRTDFENGAVKPAAHHEAAVTAMLDQVVAWGGALRTLRQSL